MQLKFITYNQCVDYLIENFYTTDFINNHTRKDLVYILQIIEAHALKQSPYAFQSMCKKRMCKHIDFYLRVHTEHRMFIKSLTTPTIILTDKFDHQFINHDEKFRRMYCFSVDGCRADMMAVIEGTGCVRAYNMDEDKYYNGDDVPNISIPPHILEVLVNMSIETIMHEFQNKQIGVNKNGRN